MVFYLHDLHEELYSNKNLNTTFNNRWDSSRPSKNRAVSRSLLQIKVSSSITWSPLNRIIFLEIRRTFTISLITKRPSPVNFLDKKPSNRIFTNKKAFNKSSPDKGLILENLKLNSYKQQPTKYAFNK